MVRLFERKWKNTMLDPIAPGEDIVPIIPGSPPIDEFAGGVCRAIRCVEAGTFTGTTEAGATRTVTMITSELLPVRFRGVTSVASGSFEAIY
jgi:hypothetical protein